VSKRRRGEDSLMSSWREPGNSFTVTAKPKGNVGGQFQALHRRVEGVTSLRGKEIWAALGPLDQVPEGKRGR